MNDRSPAARIPRRVLAGQAKIVLAVLPLLVACGASGGEAVDNIPPGLIGTWRWQETSGGIAGTTERAGEGQPVRTIEFRRDGTAVFRLDDAVTATREFAVREVQSIFDGKPRAALFYEEGSGGEIIRLSGDGQTLTLSQNAYDGFSSRYTRASGDGRRPDDGS
jgi:hypothetical protein